MKNLGKAGITSAAAAALLLGGFATTASHASSSEITFSDPVIAGKKFTAAGEACPATVGGGNLPVLTFEAMMLYFNDTEPIDPFEVITTATGWEYEGIAGAPGEYPFVQYCVYGPWDPSIPGALEMGTGTLVVHEATTPPGDGGETDPGEGETTPPGGNEGNTTPGGNEENTTPGGNEEQTSPGTPAAPALPPAPGTSASAGGVSTVKLETVSGIQYATVFAGANYAGETVFGTLFSTPQSLGAARVSGAGEATFALPTNISAGAHKLVLQRADGSVIGHTELMFSEHGWTLAAQAPVDALADSGGSLPVGLGIAAATLLTVGIGLHFVGRRQRANA